MQMDKQTYVWTNPTSKTVSWDFNHQKIGQKQNERFITSVRPILVLNDRKLLRMMIRQIDIYEDRYIDIDTCKDKQIAIYT